LYMKDFDNQIRKQHGHRIHSLNIKSPADCSLFKHWNHGFHLHFGHGYMYYFVVVVVVVACIILCQ
jgi:putative component of toxin-antitoxin plasmid stabilization module